MRREKVTRTLHKIEWTVLAVNPQTGQQWQDTIETDIIYGKPKKVLKELNKIYQTKERVAVYILKKEEKNTRYAMDWETFLKYSKEG